MPGFITVHGGGARRDVDTPLELEAWLDALAAVNPPCWARVTTTSSAALDIALGRSDLSCVHFLDQPHTPAPLASTGTLLHVLGNYDFVDEGAYRPVPAEEAIAPREAPAAICEFVRTGRRPSVVAWRPARTYGPMGGAPPLWRAAS